MDNSVCSVKRLWLGLRTCNEDWLKHVRERSIGCVTSQLKHREGFILLVGLTLCTSRLNSRVFMWFLHFWFINKTIVCKLRESAKFPEKYHLDKAVANQASNLLNNNCVSHFRHFAMLAKTDFIGQVVSEKETRNLKKKVVWRDKKKRNNPRNTVACHFYGRWLPFQIIKSPLLYTFPTTYHICH